MIDDDFDYDTWESLQQFIVANKFDRNDKSVDVFAKQNTIIKLFGLLAIFDDVLSSFNRRPLEYARNTGPRFTTYVRTINSIYLTEEYRYKVVPIFYNLPIEL